MSTPSSPKDPTERSAAAGLDHPETETHSLHSAEDIDASPTDPIDELLVSYLDGELDEKDRSELEDRLIAEQRLRSRLTELQSGWEMLDALPPANVTEDFARTTVELVTARESRLMQAQRIRKPWKKIGWLSIVAAATVTCGLVGYAIPVQIQNQEYHQQLELLPLAEHLDAYLVDIDLQLVEQLSADPTWQESMQLAIEAGGIKNPPLLDLAQRDPDNRIEVVSRADRDARVNLATNWDRLKSLDQQRLQTVEQRSQAIRDTQSPAKILSTLEQYASWWQQLSPSTQDLIIKANGEEKLDAIRREVRRSSRRWVRNFAMTLGETDRIPIHQQLLQIASDRIRLAKEQFDESTASNNEATSERPPWWRIQPESLLDFMANRPNFPGPPPSANPPNDTPKYFITLFGPLSDTELAMIEDLLSRQALAILYAESDSNSQRRETLTNWCMEIVDQMSPGTNSFESILERYKYYHYSDEEKRESLDLSKPDRIINELRGRRGGFSRRGP